ncbi:MAG: hypothetical protein V4563_14220 [Pseudomonadota bacterium]
MSSDETSPYVDSTAATGEIYTYQVKRSGSDSNIVTVHVPIIADRLTVNLTSGQCDFPHSLLYESNSNKLFAVGRDSPGQLLTANVPALDGIVAQLFDNTDNAHSYPVDLVYIASTDKIYCLFSNYATSDPSTVKKITISEIDTGDLSYTDVVRDNSTYVSTGSMATDQTYIYVLTYEPVSSTVVKYRVSDWVKVSTTTLDGLQLGHSLRFDGTNLYATGNQISGNSWIARIDLSDMSYEWVMFPSTVQTTTDDFGFSDDYAFVGFEGPSGTIAKVRKSDLSIELLDTGYVQSCYGIQGVEGAVYALFISGATLIRIDTITGDIVGYDFGGTPSINELQTDGTYIYLTQYIVSPNINRLNIP